MLQEREYIMMRSSIKVQIVNTNSIDAIKLKSFLEISGFHVVGITPSVKKALIVYNDTQPDILLIDTTFNEEKSDSNLQKLISNNTSGCIFFVNRLSVVNPEYLFKNRNNLFLQKPYDFFTVLSAIKFMIKTNLSFKNKFIDLRKKNQDIKISLDSIVYIESNGNNLNIITEDEGYIFKMSIKSILPRLSSKFIIIHKSYCINLDKVISFNNEKVNMISASLPIGRKYRNVFFETIRTLGVLS